MGLRGPLPRHSPKPSATTSPPLPPPAWLPPPAVEVWQEIEPCLRAAGRLRHEHADTLAAWACTAAELRVTGLDWTFAPTIAVARDDRWGRTYESFSEDPGIVAGKIASSGSDRPDGCPPVAADLDPAADRRNP